jgi:hypothetical protein
MIAAAFRRALVGTFFSVLLPGIVSSQIVRINIQQSYPVLPAGNQIWIGTPSGLYRYNQSDDSYKQFAPPNGRSDFRVRVLSVYKEWLWCVLDSGLAALQTRLNDWLFFDSSSGLPSSFVTGIDFQEDYAWISTPNGAARFDMLIEQWEQFDRARGLPGMPVTDIKSDGENIWMIAGNVLSEYSPQFEKWRTFPFREDSTNRANRLFLFGDDLWIVTARGLVRFIPKLQQRQTFFLPYLAAENLCEIYLEGERIWAVARNGLFFYEQQSGVWTEFEGNIALQDERISFGQVAQTQIWILTEHSTMVWDRSQKTWERLDYSSGLSSTSYSTVASDGDLTFLFTPKNLEYRRSLQDPWRTFSFEKGGAGEAARSIFTRLFDNPEGGSIRLGDYLWNWQGTRTTSIWNYSARENGETITEQSSAWRLDVKSQLELGAGRRITGFYNNVDYTETKYGARYRGNDNDYVREIAWGDFRRDPGAVPFGEAAELFGSSLWLQAGRKTERFKRSLVALKATSGEVRSRKAYKHFTGATTDFAKSIRDRDYARNQFFSVPEVDSMNSPENLEIFVDDQIAGDNTLRTLERSTIAGVTGDFDGWIPVEEFYFYPRGRAVRLLKPVLPGWTIIARYRVGNRMVESIVQSGTISTARDNFYFLGAQKITPYSFDITIKDSVGRAMQLSDFSIDDGGGKVDAQWIDYDAGILMFPAERPFPPEVYDSLRPVSQYTMEIRCQTQQAILQLEHRNLVRGSESLKLDGILAEPGNDFVLDYTNGTMIFVREGIVNPDTRIEIEYEYYDGTGNQLTSAALGISPSDRFTVQADWQRLSDDSTHLLALHGEIRQQVGSFDVRLIPGATYQTREQKVTGTSAEALVSSAWLRLQSKYESYGPDYRNIYRNQSIVGDVKDRLAFFGALDVREGLRFTGEWRQVEAFAAGTFSTMRKNPSDRTANISTLFHATDFPAVQITYQDGLARICDSTSEKRFIQSLMEYQMPKSWASAFRIQGLKSEYFLRYGRQSAVSASGLFKQEFMQTYYKLNAMVSEQFQTGFFFRRNMLYDAALEGPAPLMTSSDRLLGDIAFGEWRFMQVNSRIENTLQRDFHRNGVSSTYYLRQFYQVNARISPGQVWQKLTPLFFELTYNQSATQTDVSIGSDKPSVWSIETPERTGGGLFTVSKNTFMKNEFRPDANWLISTLLEWNSQHTESGNTGLGRNTWKYTEKVDARLGYTTRMIAQYRKIVQKLGFGRGSRTHEPSLWMEQRWTQDFLSTAQLIYRWTALDDRVVLGTRYEWEGLLDFVLRKDRWLLMRHIEFRQSFSGSRQKQICIPALLNCRIGATTSIDLYPINSLIVRLRLDGNRFFDEMLGAGSYSTIDFTLKLSLQL